MGLQPRKPLPSTVQMEYIAIAMRSSTICPSILVFLSATLAVLNADSSRSFEPEKSLIRYRFLKEQKPHDKESLYDELMSLRGWVKGELGGLDVAAEPTSSNAKKPAIKRQIYKTPVQSPVRVSSHTTQKTRKDNPVRSVAYGALEKEARSAYRSKDYQRAVSIYSDLIRMGPEEQFYLYRARSHKNLENFSEAVRDFENLDMMEQPPTVGMELVRAYSKSGQISKAISLGERLHGRYSDFARIRLTLAILYKKEKKFDRALPLFKEYLSLDPDEPLALLELGNLMEKTKKWPEALEIYNKLLKIDRRHKLGIRNRGNVLYRLKRYDDAARDLEASGQLSIPWVKKLYTDSKERAAKQTTPPSLPPPTGILTKIPKVDTAHARKLAEQIKPVPEPTPVKAKPTPPRKPPVVITHPIDVRMAKKLPDSLRTSAGRPATAVVSAGTQAFKDRKYHEAVDLLRLEVRKNPHALKLSETYLQALQRLKNYNEIINEYERLQKVLPGYVDFGLEKNFFRLSLNKFNTVLDGIPEKHPSPYAQFLRSLAFNGLGREEEARKALENAASLDPRFERPDSGSLLWLIRVKNYQDAYYLGKDLITNPSDWMYYEMARLTWALGNGVEAVLYLTKTVQVDPNNSEAFFLLAKIMHSLQRFEDRDVFIQKAQVLDPESLDIRLWQQSIEN